MTPHLLGRFGDIHALLFAVLLIVSVIFLPQGFGGVAAQLWQRASGRKLEARP